MKRGVCILWMVMAWLQTVCAGEWQWVVTLKGFVSDETKKEPETFLWIPENCEKLSALMWSQQNMTEETLFEMPSFRDSLAEMGVGLIWIAPGIDQQWDVRKGTQKVFDQIMNDLAEVSGYTELREVPLILSDIRPWPLSRGTLRPGIQNGHWRWCLSMGMRRAPICAVTGVKTWSGDGRGTLTAFPA